MDGRSNDGGLHYSACRDVRCICINVACIVAVAAHCINSKIARRLFLDREGIIGHLILDRDAFADVASSALGPR